MRFPTPILVAAAFACAASLHAQGPVVSVAVDQPGASINPSMWGVFFEDINFGADGGLYAELVKNRSFEFPEHLMGWKATSAEPAAGSLAILDAAPAFPENPHYVRITSKLNSGYGIENEGFRGIGLHARDAYEFSVRARSADGRTAALRVELVAADGGVLAGASLPAPASAWGTLRAELTPARTEAHAHLRVLLAGEGDVDLDQVSLFPAKTWRDRPGGLRADMVQALADLKPGFLRFPGGCIVEGPRLDLRYQWKKTLGPVEQRRLLYNRWNSEFKNRAAPDYYQSFGLGFFEYFQLCEDIGASPLPILNCGMACQFNSGELAPLDQLQPYIQDALDLIEFANGPVDSPWGAKRAAMGHPEPFHLAMLGVGNEQWGAQYVERYARFAAALKKAHPEIQLVSCAGPSPSDDRYHYAWPRLRELHADIIDEHVYDKPSWFFANARRYDDFDRSGPRVLMGEYAAQSLWTGNPANRNTLECALAEAAFMTGLERNADIVRMASYAPLFAHVDAWQWTPDLIWVDNLGVRRTPSYWVQWLFSRNRGEQVLPCAVSGLAAPSSDGREELYASAVRDHGDIVVKIVNPGATPRRIAVALHGAKALGTGEATVLSGSALDEENAPAHPDRIQPAQHPLPASAASFNYDAPAYSVSVLRLPLSR